MIMSRLLSFILRFGEFICAAVVLGLAGHFLRIHHNQGTGPKGREIYTTIIAAWSVVLSLLWLLPFTHTFMHYPLDLLTSFGWFAAFGALVDWIHRINCGQAFNWGFIYHGGVCGQWKAAEAFSFIAAVFWLVSALLSAYVFHKRSEPVATDGAANGTGRRRWGRKSQV